MKKIKNKLRKTIPQKYTARMLLLGILLLMIAFLGIKSEFFFTFKNLRNILNQSSIYLILSVGMTFVICSGGIDLSVGSVMAMSGLIMACCMNASVPVGLSIVIGLLSSTFLGMLNGCIISFLNINPFIGTLSMMSIMRGIVILITDGKPVYGFTREFTFWGSGKVGPANPPIIMAILVVVIGSILLERTKFGNYCFFHGSNEAALYRAGINTKWCRICIYSLSAFCAGVAGFIVSARLNTAEPLAGQGYEMDAIAAVVLGGTSMQGGQGSISGTVIACLVLNVMRNGLTMLSISSNYQTLLTGIIVLIAVAISEIQNKK
ncbi:ABC transporter permease [Lachnospiraceae bacterium LCP25S3_G4]